MGEIALLGWTTGMAKAVGMTVGIALLTARGNRVTEGTLIIWVSGDGTGISTEASEDGTWIGTPLSREFRSKFATSPENTDS